MDGTAGSDIYPYPSETERGQDRTNQFPLFCLLENQIYGKDYWYAVNAYGESWYEGEEYPVRKSGDAFFLSIS